MHLGGGGFGNPMENLKVKTKVRDPPNLIPGIEIIIRISVSDFFHNTWETVNKFVRQLWGVAKDFEIRIRNIKAVIAAEAMG